MTNLEIRKMSIAKLRGNWLICILTCIIFSIIIGLLSGPQSIYSSIVLSAPYYLLGGIGVLVIFIGWPLSVGLVNAFKMFWLGDKDIISNMFNIPFKNYIHIVAGSMLYAVLLVLWTLLLIVPGIIKSMAYFCVPFLLVDEPDLTPMEAIHKSEQMMYGHKMDLFKMGLGFIGLALLCLLTLGIGYLWLFPYIINTQVGFYLELKGQTVPVQD